MDKVILVMDNPMFCSNCPLAKSRKHIITKEVHWFCGIGHKTDKDYCWKRVDMDSKIKPDWCPLKPVPEEQDVWYDDESSDWERGYNSCLREIVDK